MQLTDLGSYQSLTGAFRYSWVIALRPINLYRARISPLTVKILQGYVGHVI